MPGTEVARLVLPIPVEHLVALGKVLEDIYGKPLYLRGEGKDDEQKWLAVIRGDDES